MSKIAHLALIGILCSTAPVLAKNGNMSGHSGNKNAGQPGNNGNNNPGHHGNAGNNNPGKHGNNKDEMCSYEDYMDHYSHMSYGQYRKYVCEEMDD